MSSIVISKGANTSVPDSRGRWSRRVCHPNKSTPSARRHRTVVIWGRRPECPVTLFHKIHSRSRPACHMRKAAAPSPAFCDNRPDERQMPLSKAAYEQNEQKRDTARNTASAPSNLHSPCPRSLRQCHRIRWKVWT